MNKHLKALKDLGIFLLIFLMSAIVVCTLMGLFVWFLGEGKAMIVLGVLCVVGLYVKLYKNEA